MLLRWFSPPLDEGGPAADLTTMVRSHFEGDDAHADSGSADVDWAELVIYQLEDRPQGAAAVAAALLQEPGIVVLHGSSWPRLCLEAARRDEAGRERYLAAVEDGWGAAGRAMALEAVLSGYRPQDHDPRVLTTLELLLGDSLGVVVASDELFERLAGYELWPLLRLSLPEPVGTGVRSPRVSCLPLGGRPLGVVVAEAGDAGRSVESVFAALAGWGARARVRLRVLAGRDRQEFWRAQALRGGLGEVVEVYRHDDLAAVLDNSHVGVDLEGTHEGSSPWVRRYRAFGLPVLVSSSGWYGAPDFSETWCARVDPQGEGEDIRRFLADAIAEPEEFERRAARARERQQHQLSPVAWVARVRDFAAQIERHPEIWRARFLLSRFARAVPRCRASVIPAYRRAALRVVEPLLVRQDLQASGTSRG